MKKDKPLSVSNSGLSRISTGSIGTLLSCIRTACKISTFQVKIRANGKGLQFVAAVTIRGRSNEICVSTLVAVVPFVFILSLSNLTHETHEADFCQTK